MTHLTTTTTGRLTQSIGTTTEKSIIHSTIAPTVSSSWSRLRPALRLLPAAFLLAGMISLTPSAGATGCHVAPSSLSVYGGSSSNSTTVNPRANGGVAISNAQGGDGNLAFAFWGNADAGNGGTAASSANGGIIAIGDVNSGYNTGNVIKVKAVQPKYCAANSSRIVITGGTASTTTTVNPQANGGIAAANAQGGDDNLALGILGNAAAGNGGTAEAQANGGSIAIGDVNSGGNVGNVIQTDGFFGAGSTAIISGGASSNSTTVNPQANGGTALSNAQGGDDNVAVGILGDAAAGNGGTATSSANGGAVAMGDVNSGGNVGNVVQTGGLSGNAAIGGGASDNSTTVNPEANGGTAVSNAEGGDDNLALGVFGDAAAGNGGTATSSADGGAITMGDVNSGDNVGNVIEVGS